MFFDRLVDFLKKNPVAGERAPGAMAEAKIPLADAAPNLGITPKAGVNAPEIMSGGNLYANPIERMAEASRAPMASPVPQQEAIPRLAGRDVKTELALRANDPNPDVRFDTPMQEERFNYVTRNGDPRESHRGFKAGVKDFFKGGLLGAAQADPRAGLAGVLGGFIGGGAGSAVMGKKDPVALEERQFEMLRAPQIRSDQQDRNAQLKMQAEIDFRQAQARQEGIQSQIAINNAKIAEEDHKRKMQTPVTVPQGAAILKDGKWEVPSPREQSKPSPHWVLNEDNEYVNLNDSANSGRVVRGVDKTKELSPSDALAIGKLEASANFDPSNVRRQFVEGVRGEYYQKNGISADVLRLAQNPQKTEDGFDWTPESKRAMEVVSKVNDLVERQADDYVKSMQEKLSAQAAQERLKQPRKRPQGGKTAVNLYDFDANRYGFPQ